MPHWRRGGTVGRSRSGTRDSGFGLGGKPFARVRRVPRVPRGARVSRSGCGDRPGWLSGGSAEAVASKVGAFTRENAGYAEAPASVSARLRAEWGGGSSHGLRRRGRSPFLMRDLARATQPENPSVRPFVRGGGCSASPSCHRVPFFEAEPTHREESIFDVSPGPRESTGIFVRSSVRPGWSIPWWAVGRRTWRSPSARWPPTPVTLSSDANERSLDPAS